MHREIGTGRRNGHKTEQVSVGLGVATAGTTCHRIRLRTSTARLISSTRSTEKASDTACLRSTESTQDMALVPHPCFLSMQITVWFKCPLFTVRLIITHPRCNAATYQARCTKCKACKGVAGADQQVRVLSTRPRPLRAGRIKPGEPPSLF